MYLNPSKGWVKELFFDRYKKGALPAHWKYISSRVFDNPFIASDEKYMTSLKDMRPNQYKMFVEGDWNVKLEGCIFDTDAFKRFRIADLTGEPDATYAYIDVKDEGTLIGYGMIVAKIFGAKYNDKRERIVEPKVYIVDIILTKDNVDVSIPMCAGMLTDVWI